MNSRSPFRAIRPFCRPIWSHALSLVGFWGLAFFYPLQGVHHFLGSPIPMFAQYSAVVSTPAEFAAFIAEETDRWAAVVAKLGLKVE